MDTNFQSQIQKIIDTLKSKAGDFQCPICRSKNFSLNDGYFAHDLQANLKERVIGGRNIPTIPVVCTQCGYMLEFAVGTLGLLPDKEQSQTATEKK